VFFMVFVVIEPCPYHPVVPHMIKLTALGGNLIKKRVARAGKGKRGGYGTIIVYPLGSRAVFVYGFPKSAKANPIPNCIQKSIKQCFSKAWGTAPPPPPRRYAAQCGASAEACGQPPIAPSARPHALARVAEILGGAGETFPRSVWGYQALYERNLHLVLARWNWMPIKSWRGST
jgi:hypothetical protein